VDLWSLGCILCEMLFYTKTPFFSGSTQKILLEDIIRIIGSPSSFLLSYYNSLGCDKVSAVCLNVLNQSKNRASILHEVLINLPSDVHALVIDLLQFDPKERKTAAQALKSPFFSAYYDSNDEDADLCETEFTQPSTDSCQKMRAYLWELGNSYELKTSSEKRRRIDFIF